MFGRRRTPSAINRSRLPLRIDALDRRDLPSAALPFADGFESGVLGANWGQSATNNGSINVIGNFTPISGSKQLYVGPSNSGINSRSEAILHLDLGGTKNAVLSFKQKEFNDLDHDMPATFSGTSNSDGVALSVDGSNWVRIVSLVGTASQNVTQIHTYNLGEIAAKNGLSLTGDTQIKFQNYGLSPAPNGGFAFDDVNVTIAGTVNGKVYQDANQDGAYQAGEALAPGHKIYVDSNNDGRLNLGTATAVFTEQLPAPILDAKRSLYPMFVYGIRDPIIGDVDVNIALAHTYAGDLDISLIAPDGRRVLLSSDNGGSGDNYFVTTFDDDAATAITAGSAPFSGTYRPEGKLSDLNGGPMYGWWFLEIVDDAANDTGTLAGWSLDLGEKFTTVVNKTISESEVMYEYLQLPTSSYEDMDVVVNIDHPNVSDLTMLLATPGNQYIYLAENYGGTGNNFVNTRFDDEAAVAISAGAAPFTGHYRPMEKLSTFDDSGVTNFQLRVADDKAGNVGFCKDFSMILTNTWTAGADPVLAGNPTYADRYADFRIPDLGGPIVDLDVLVHIDHSNDSVLNLELSNVAANKSVTLTSGNSLQGASGNDFHNTTFDDEAKYQVIGGTGPYTGTYRPHAQLAGFDGLDAEGDWKLKVDNTKLAGGQLNWAALIISTADNRADLTVRSVPDQTTVTAPLPVTGLAGAIADLDVRVNIIHPYVSDLDVYLTAPNGRVVELVTDVGLNGDNFSGLILDDEAAATLAQGSSPFNGRFRPEGSLADFDGINPNGTWTLTITDDAANDSGLLTSWSLDITTGERFAVSDANGEYSFENLAPGSVAIRVDENNGIDWTNPDSGKYTESIAYGSSLPGRDFGYVSDNQAPSTGWDFIVPNVRNTPVGSVVLYFSEPVTGVDIADFALEQSGSAISLAGATVTTNDNIHYTIGNLAGLNTTNGLYTLKLNSVNSGILDAAGNALASFDNPAIYWKLDVTAPQVLSLVRTDAAVTTASTLSWQYQFTESVLGLSPTNFAISGSGAAGAQVVSVVGGYVYVNTFGNGNITLSMVNSTGAADGAGNQIGNLPFTGETYTIARPNNHASVMINDGAAQRSRVLNMKVNFDYLPTFKGAFDDLFALKRTADGAVVTLDANLNGSTAELEFTGGPLEYGSLTDGLYTLTVNGVNIGNFDQNNDGTVGDTYNFDFHRLFGDVDGDRDVDVGDFAAFRNAYGSAFTPLAVAFDYSGDNDVDTTDYAYFRTRFGSSI